MHGSGCLLCSLSTTPMHHLCIALPPNRPDVTHAWSHGAFRLIMMLILARRYLLRSCRSMELIRPSVTLDRDRTLVIAPESRLIRWLPFLMRFKPALVHRNTGAPRSLRGAEEVRRAPDFRQSDGTVIFLGGRPPDSHIRPISMDVRPTHADTPHTAWPSKVTTCRSTRFRRVDINCRPYSGARRPL